MSTEQMARLLAARPACGSELLSRHVASFCVAHPNAIDGAVLATLTPAAAMPTIASTVALELLRLALAHEPGSDAVSLGLGRIVALCYFPSTLHRKR
jgi:hypothetical protein